MPSSVPEISVGMPVYNGARYIRKAIDSILQQSFGDFELIISDNASVDSTPQICEQYVRQDPRIQYVRQATNLGAPRNWNFVAERATAPYFKWAAANDVCDPRMLEKCKEILDAHPDVVACYPKTKLIDQNDDVIEEYRVCLHLPEPSAVDRFMNLLMTIGLNSPLSGLIRTDALRSTPMVGTYQQSDINLTAELSLRGRIYEVPEFLFFRRMSADAVTRDKSKEELREYHVPGEQRWYLPAWRYNLAFFGVVHRSSIKRSEKLRLYFFIARMLNWNRKRLFQELVGTLLPRTANRA